MDFAVLPSIEALLLRPSFAAAIAKYGRASVLREAQAAIARVRQSMKSGKRLPADRDGMSLHIEKIALARLDDNSRTKLVRVFNLTGTVLHTNLGRAPLAQEAIDAMRDAAGSVSLEYDLTAGKRGERDDHIASVLCRLTGAESALAVNNNAAAVLLSLNSIANRREVIVSRGELVEIGGAFRIPDVMARAGCRLVEVGTTNRTHLSDYESAIGPRTAAIMKVHQSNFAVEGFTSAVQDADLAALAQKAGVPLIVDLGSGSLIDLRPYGLPYEARPHELLAVGADLVTFSGDKLLGGAQAGFIVGKTKLLQALKRNPMRRALRLDKIILAALEATLRLYEDPDTLAQRLPTLRLLTRSADDIRATAERIVGPLQRYLNGHATVSVAPCQSQIGSGSLPVDLLPSWGLAIAPLQQQTKALMRLVDDLRALPIPVIGRIQNDTLVLDLRCLEDDSEFVDQLVTTGEPRAS